MDNGRNSGSFTDRSGTATTTSAQLAAQNSFRRFLYIQNQDATIAIYVNFGTSATAGSGSIKIAAGAAIQLDQFVSTDQVNVISASGTPAFTAKEG